MDDIVTRLRELADADVYMADISVSKLYEAADEIEDLRAELAECRRQYTALKAIHEKDVRNA